MLRLSLALVPLLLIVACDEELFSRIDATRRGPPPPPADDDDDDDGPVPEPPVDPPLTLRDCAPSVLNGCGDPEAPSGVPATLPIPLGALPEACSVDAFVADNQAACGDVVDVVAGAGVALDDVIATCTPGTLCRVQLRPGRSLFVGPRRNLHCVHLVGDDDGTSEIELDGATDLHRVAIESVKIAGAGAGASVIGHALFLDVDIVAESTGIHVASGDVKICASTIRAGDAGVSFGSRAPATGLLVSHSVVAGCYAGVEVAGQQVEIADSIVQGTYEALDAEAASDVLLRRSRFVSITEAVDTLRVDDDTACSDDVCGIDLGTCGDRVVDLTLPPFVDATGPVAPAGVATRTSCEPNQVVELAATIDLQDVRDGGVDTHPGATAGGQSYAWCIDTLRFTPVNQTWAFDTGDGSASYAAAFAEPCEQELCGALHFADGVVVEQACTMFVQCNLGFGAVGFVSMRPGDAVRID